MLCIRHCQIILRQACKTSTPDAKSRGAPAFAKLNSVHGGAARIPYTPSGGLYVRTSCSGSVTSLTSYPASRYGRLQAPVPPHRSRIILSLLHMLYLLKTSIYGNNLSASLSMPSYRSASFRCSSISLLYRVTHALQRLTFSFASANLPLSVVYMA